MKKVIFKLWLLAALAFATVACSQDDGPMPTPAEEQPDSNSQVNLRSVEAAVKIAEMATIGDDANSRSARTVKGVSSVNVIKSRNSRGESETLIYAVDFDDNQGFALVAAPENVEPLLAVIDKGSFNSSETENNEGFQYALNAAKNYVSTMSFDVTIGGYEPITPIKPEPIAKLWYYDTIKPAPKVAPRVKTVWNQGWPAGKLFANHISGCGPIAIAQMAGFLKVPTSIDYTYPGKDRANENLNWNDIALHNGILGYTPNEYQISTHIPKCNASAGAHETLARVVRQIGYLSNADDYTSTRATSTGTNADFATMKKIFAGKTFMDGTSPDGLFHTLRYHNAVAYVRGDEGTGQPGHAWVADATWQVGMVVRYMESTPIIGLDGKTTYVYEEKSRTGEIKDYIHFNWGWDGYDNGYFLSTMFNTADGYEYDTPSQIGHNTYKFNNNVRFLAVY